MQTFFVINVIVLLKSVFFLFDCVCFLSIILADNLVIIFGTNFNSSQKKTNIPFKTKSFSRIEEGEINALLLTSRESPL